MQHSLCHSTNNIHFQVQKIHQYHSSLKLVIATNGGISNFQVCHYDTAELLSPKNVFQLFFNPEGLTEAGTFTGPKTNSVVHTARI